MSDGLDANGALLLAPWHQVRLQSSLTDHWYNGSLLIVVCHIGGHHQDSTVHIDHELILQLQKNLCRQNRQNPLALAVQHETDSMGESNEHLYGRHSTC